jgi:hypothetical protein
MDVIEHIRKGVLIDEVRAFKVVDQILMLKQPMRELVFISGGMTCGGLSLGKQICRLIPGHSRFTSFHGTQKPPSSVKCPYKEPYRGQKTVRFFCQNTVNLGNIPALRYLLIQFYQEFQLIAYKSAVA